MAPDGERRAANVAPKPQRAAIDAVIDAALAEQRLVGAVVLVAKDGQVIYRRAAGLADRATRRPMREDTVFLLASVTKPLVSAAAMRLVEDGVLDLAAPVSAYLPDFQPALPDGSRPAITLDALFTHRAGLSYGFGELPDSLFHTFDISSGLDRPGRGMDDNLARLARAPLLYPPGTSWRYSMGIDVVGAAMQAATGRKLADLVADYVTRPLAMHDTGFAPPDRGRLATPYANAAGEPAEIAGRAEIDIGSTGILVLEPERAFDATSFPSGGAGMVGTAPDMLRFFETIRTGGAPILRPDTIAAMTRDAVGPQAAAAGPGWGFGRGWAVLADPVLAGTPQHAGTLQWGGVYGHCWFVDQAAGLSVVALTNTTPEGMAGPFTTELRDAIYAG